LNTDNDAPSVVQHKTQAITVQTGTVHTRPLSHGLIVRSVTKILLQTHTTRFFTRLIMTEL